MDNIILIGMPGPGKSTVGVVLADVYRYRAPLYERCAHITVPAGGQSPADTVQRVKEALAAR